METLKDMEYLIKLLHKEWERSGVTKVKIIMNLAYKEVVFKRLAEEVEKIQKLSHVAEIDFQECMKLSKESFLLLRIANKIHVANEVDNEFSFTVVFDKEEYQLFLTLMKSLEV